MSNPIYALTNHDHTEEELAPWLAECGTGDPMVDGLVLTALDCAWGHWERAAKEPRHMGGLVRYDTAYALAGFEYLTFRKD